MNRKLFFSLCLTFLVSAFIFGEEPEYFLGSTPSIPESNTNCDNIVNYFTPDPSISVTVISEASNYQNFKLYTLNLSSIVEADFTELKSRVGINFSQYNFNIFTEAVYAPTFFNIFNAGFHLINHFNWNFGNYFDFDFLPGLYVSYNATQKLHISASYFYQLKASVINAIQKQKSSVISNSMAFDLIVDYTSFKWLTTSISISSYSMFRYYLFLSPNFRILNTFQVNPNLYLGIAAEAQFVDFFTLSANFNKLTCDISATWRF